MLAAIRSVTAAPVVKMIASGIEIEQSSPTIDLVLIKAEFHIIYDTIDDAVSENSKGLS